MTATLTFATRPDAEAFAKAYSRKTLRGHDISSGTENVQVKVYGVDEFEKNWIDEYVSSANA